MSTELLSSTAAGALFGSALTSSGVYLPSVILSQMELQNFRMLKVFLTASATSALAIALYERLVGKQLTRRSPSNLGWLGSYDGNIIGGAMVGAGMTLTGACPGTVVVQVGTGVSSGRYAILGGVLGGIFYALVAKRIRRNAACPSPPPAEQLSLPGKLGLRPNMAILMFEGMCLAMIVAIRQLVPESGHIKTLVDPVVGGLFIGLAQLATLLLTKSPVGVSSFYEDVGHWFWSLFGYQTKSGAMSKAAFLPLTRAVAFAGGILASSYTLSKTVPDSMMQDALTISPARGILGGFVMVMGARMAGGCTSGHGITGMSMLGISSIITVASMFAGGIGLALLL